jgi:hypothetical protein
MMARDIDGPQTASEWRATRGKQAEAQAVHDQAMVQPLIRSDGSQRTCAECAKPMLQADDAHFQGYQDCLDCRGKKNLARALRGEI